MLLTQAHREAISAVGGAAGRYGPEAGARPELGRGQLERLGLGQLERPGLQQRERLVAMSEWRNRLSASGVQPLEN